MDNQAFLAPTVTALYQLLQRYLPDLAFSHESNTWAVPWYLPTRDNPGDGHFEYYEYHQGISFPTYYFPEQPLYTPAQPDRNIGSLIRTIVKGEANTGLHRATRDLAHGLINDGVNQATVKALLHGLTTNYVSSNERQRENKGKIDKLVESADKKLSATVVEPEKKKTNMSLGTQYPDQGGYMQRLIDDCLTFPPIIDFQSGVLAGHVLISLLGGRVYSYPRNCNPSGKGIVFNTLLTAGTGRGKSFVKLCCNEILERIKIGEEPALNNYLGSTYYTAVINLYEEIQQRPSLLTIRSESGQFDQSKAGDMKRLLGYELEIATQHGASGIVNAGGQKDKISTIYSPAVTTLRESVDEIQNEADLINQSIIGGLTGRRHHTILPLKKPYNVTPTCYLSSDILALLTWLHRKAQETDRQLVQHKMKDDKWIWITYQNPNDICQMMNYWTDKYNEYEKEGKIYEKVCHSRLIEKVPAWAARLAICDNAYSPVVTTQHLDIAYKSILAEMDSSIEQLNSGQLDGNFEQCMQFIIKNLSGNLISKATLKSMHEQKKKLHILKKNHCVKSIMFNMLEKYIAYKNHPDKARLRRDINTSFSSYGINVLSKDESKCKFKHNGELLTLLT